jgi:hypothetical protein
MAGGKSRKQSTRKNNPRRNERQSLEDELNKEFEEMMQLIQRAKAAGNSSAGWYVLESPPSIPGRNQSVNQGTDK